MPRCSQRMRGAFPELVTQELGLCFLMEHRLGCLFVLLKCLSIPFVAMLEEVLLFESDLDARDSNIKQIGTSHLGCSDE